MSPRIRSSKFNIDMYKNVDDGSLKSPKSRNGRRSPSPWSKKKKNEPSMVASSKRLNAIQINTEECLSIIRKFSEEEGASSFDFENVHNKKTTDEHKVFLIYYFGLKNGLVEKVPSPACSFVEPKIRRCKEDTPEKSDTSSKLSQAKNSEWVDFDDEKSEDTFTTCSVTDTSWDAFDIDPHSFSPQSPKEISNMHLENGQLFPKDSIMFDESMEKLSLATETIESLKSLTKHERQKMSLTFRPSSSTSLNRSHVTGSDDIITSHTEDKDSRISNKIEELMLLHSSVSGRTLQIDGDLKQKTLSSQEDGKLQNEHNFVNSDSTKPVEPELNLISEKQIIDTRPYLKKHIKRDESNYHKQMESKPKLSPLREPYVINKRHDQSSRNSSLSSTKTAREKLGVPPLYPYQKVSSDQGNSEESISNDESDDDSQNSYEMAEFDEDDEANSLDCYFENSPRIGKFQFDVNKNSDQMNNKKQTVSEPKLSHSIESYHQSSKNSSSPIHEKREQLGVPPLYPSKNSFPGQINSQERLTEDDSDEDSQNSFEMAEFDEDDEFDEDNGSPSRNHNYEDLLRIRKSDSTETESSDGTSISFLQKYYETTIDDCESSTDSSSDEDDWKKYAYGYYSYDEMNCDSSEYKKNHAFESAYNSDNDSESSSDHEESSNTDVDECGSFSDCSSLYFHGDCKADSGKTIKEIVANLRIPKQVQKENIVPTLAYSDEESTKQNNPKESCDTAVKSKEITRNSISSVDSDDYESLCGLGFINETKSEQKASDQSRPSNLADEKSNTENKEFVPDADNLDSHLSVCLKSMQEENRNLLLNDDELKQDVSDLISNFLRETEREKGRRKIFKNDHSTALSEI